ncbi:MAG: CehA/McbA family metallohydrolase, partial [Planctomycetes bacterium]|nr:CehA/McbA family metallohydrolase [Planctomycetota bacterium]
TDGQPGEIIQVSHDDQFGSSRLYFGNNDLHIQPTWTADGESLLCVSNHTIPLGSGGIWKMPAVKNGFDKAVKIHAEETLYRTRPHVSPDGKRFIYSSHLGGQFNNLFVLPTDGGEPYKMTFGTWDSFHPRFSPDGESIAYISNQDGLPQLHILKTYGGVDKKVEIKSLVWKQPTGVVQVNIVDDITNEVLPARVYPIASDGKTYVPAGAYHRVGSQNRHFFHTSGEFTLNVPIGELTIEAMHGFEYYTTAKTINVKPGNNTVEIRLPRMSNLADQDWYSIDTHMHMNYAGNLHNTPENMLMMARAEDLNISNVLVANKDNRVLDYQFYTGKPHPVSEDRHIIFFGEEYRPPFYGHISLINLTDHLISPFTTGYQGTAIESLYPSNTDIFRLAKQQGALGGYVHPFPGSSDPLRGSLGGAKGFPVDLALGVLDYHEIVSWVSWAGYNVWHHALNNGFRIPAVGGEDAISNLHHNRIVGQTRTYAYMPDGLTWQNWLDALKKAHLFVTNGPLLKMEIEGKIPGDQINLPKTGGKVTIKGIVQCIVPIDFAELVVNGEKIQLADFTENRDPNQPGLHFEFQKEIEITTSSWITLQAYSRRSVHPIDDSFVQATTNPIWIICGDQPVRSTESAQYFIRWIDKLTQMSIDHPGWRSEQEKTHVLDQYQQAKTVYQNLLQQALQLEQSSRRH